MSGNLAIIVILGSQKAGRKLAIAISHPRDDTGDGKCVQDTNPTQRQIRPVEGYSQTFPFRAIRGKATLLEIERHVLRRITKLGGTASNVVSIVFMYTGDSTDFPFKSITRFLGFSGPTLYGKLTVVASVPSHDLKRRWSDLVKDGMRIVGLENQPDVLLRQILLAKNSEMDQSSSSNSRNSTQISLAAPIPSSSVSSELLSHGANFARVYKEAADMNSRDAKQTVILLVGQNGHGKSKTINRLIGQDLLPIGRTTLGSTTKVIQRVKLLSTSEDTSTTVTVAFDDTPGLEDTTYVDRASNASLMRRYKQEHFRYMYPNVVLLVASWNSIMPDAHNKPSNFTSALGKSIYNLHLSGLVDNERANVLVVVTKSMSSWDQFDDFETIGQKNIQWQVEAGRRRGIITEIQRRILPKLAPWEIVFIENGGGRDMSANFPILPDGQLSHQNLYNAICNIVERPGPHGNRDITGIHSLQILTGAAPFGPLSGTEVETLVQQSAKDVIVPEAMEMIPSEDRILELATSYLGVTFDTPRGTFGRTSVLSLDDLPIQFTGTSHQNEEFHEMNIAHQQQSVDLPRPDHLRAHYSSSWAFQSAVSTNLQCYILHHVLKVATVDLQRLELSAEIRELIDSLPPYSVRSKPSYLQFFSNYGTHVVTKLALGGVLRVIADSRDGGTEGKSSHRRSIMVFRDGGASAASELTGFLEDYFLPDPNSPGWQQVRTKWTNDLERNPVFCPDHPLTEYRPIYTMPGLTEDQKKCLQEAYRSYVAWIPHHVGRPKSNVRPRPSKHDSLPRQKNLISAVKLLRDSVAEALSRLANVGR